MFVSFFNGICSVLLGFVIFYLFNYLIMMMILIMIVMFMMIVIVLLVIVSLFVWFLYRLFVILLVDFKFVEKKMNFKVSKRILLIILFYNFVFRWELCR